MDQTNVWTLSLSLSLSLPLLIQAQVTGSGDANAVPKWIVSGGGGGGNEDGDATELTTTTLYYSNSKFGIHTSSPLAPLHVIGNSLFEGDPDDDYNRLYLCHAPGFYLQNSNTIGYLGFNMWRGLNSTWYRYSDQTYNGGSLILGNTKGDLFFGNVASTGGYTATLPDTSMMSKLNMTLTHEGRLGLGLISPRTNLEIVNNSNTQKCGFILNQTSQSMNTNEIQFHRNGAEKWAIGSYISESHPNSFYCLSLSVKLV